MIMSSRIRNKTVVVVVFITLLLGTVVASSSSSPRHNKKKRRKGELRRTNRRIGNDHEYEYFYHQRQQQRALKKQEQKGMMMMMMMSMGHHDASLVDYFFTDDTPPDAAGGNMEATGDEDSTSGIANASFDSGIEGQQLGNNTGSNDSLEVTIGFIGDDDENVGVPPPAIVDHGMDVNVGMEGIHDSTTTLESSSSVSDKNSNNFDSNNGILTTTMSSDGSSVTGSSSESNTDNVSLNSSSSGISDSTPADSSSVADFDGSDISEFIASTGGASSSTVSANNTDGGSSHSSNTGNNRTDSSTSNSTTSAIPLTLPQRKSIIKSKCQLSIHSRSQAILTLIGSLVSNPELTLVTQVGPQYQAFVWLVHFDDAILCPPSSKDNERMVQRILQRYTLASLYFSMNGNEWTNCPSSRKFFDDSTRTVGVCDNAVRFLDESHECNWYGITCAGDVENGVEYDVDSHYAIETIILPNNNLSGAIPTEFYKAFDKLRVWNMEKNEGVLGTLSNGVGRLTQLEVLLL
jgi:hypothetical protein